jgi:hypothetical protein
VHFGKVSFETVPVFESVRRTIWMFGFWPLRSASLIAATILLM